MSESIEKFLVLAPATLHILLALAAEDMHGYAIMQEVTRQSEGVYRLGPGTLYDNLQRMMNQGLVEELTVTPGEDSRRRIYRLSRLGRKVLSAELTRLETVVRDGRRRMNAALFGR